MTQSNNRSLTLDGANKVFIVAGITIEQSELGFYQSKGFLELQNKTLTGLCQQIVLKLKMSIPSALPDQLR